jgi:hypothetical protein
MDTALGKMKNRMDQPTGFTKEFTSIDIARRPVEAQCLRAMSIEVLAFDYLPT